VIDANEVAKRLIEAERARTEITAFSSEYDDFSLEQAYEAQAAFVQAKLDAGDTVVGYKVGLTSRAKQREMGVDQPVYGTVTSSMLGTYGERIDLERFIHPRVEPEISFLLARDIPAPATVTSVLAATEAVFAAIDVIDSRYADYRFALPDVVADNASSGLFLLGPQARRPDEVGDLRLLGCVLRADGVVAQTAAGAAVLGHPAASVAWLANQLAARQRVLPAGSLVFSGGLTDSLQLRAGHSVTAEFDRLGTVEVFA
jgi:2-oxo-3-hexenedioate decarboxylase